MQIDLGVSARPPRALREGKDECSDAQQYGEDRFPAGFPHEAGSLVLPTAKTVAFERPGQHGRTAGQRR